MNPLFERAKTLMPGGVNSPVRAFQGVGGTPFFIAKAKGAYLFDTEGKAYIDYVSSWGTAILGHAPESILDALNQAAARGLSFGASCELELQLAEKILKLMPHLEQIRMLNSGTEATLTAIRLARGFTNRNFIIKFAGCYHGHNDSLLVKAGSGALTLGVPNSAGIPAELARYTLVAEYNRPETLAPLFEQYGEQIAAIIVEPVAANMNCVLPLPDFLQALRKYCDQYQSLLIFDEVITGFRTRLGEVDLGVKSDLTTLGKIIGGGLPIGALAGPKKVMEFLAPLGPVYQAGTLSGNPLAMACGLASLEALTQPGFYEKLSATTNILTTELKQLAQEFGIPFTTQHIGGLFGLFFSEEEPITYYHQVQQCNLKRFQKFFHGMLEDGVYFAPSMYESGFISIAHGAEEIDQTIQAARKNLRDL